MRVRVAGIVIAGALALAGGAQAQPRDQADAVQAYERDVYVIVGSTLRNPDDTTAAGATLFNSGGSNLGFTWGTFSGASATSGARRVSVDGRTYTDFKIALTGLRPSGVYSLFYVALGPDSENPLCPGVERGLPLKGAHPHSQQPDFASFVAGADGTATYHGLVRGNLLKPQQLFLELVFHSDGKTWGSLPNHGEFNTQGPSCRSSYGDDAMRQLVITQKGL
jgi:hypothetical protein